MIFGQISKRFIDFVCVFALPKGGGKGGAPKGGGGGLGRGGGGGGMGNHLP